MDGPTSDGTGALGVPAACAAVLDAVCGVHVDVAAALVVVGERTEVDLDALAREHGDDVARALAGFWERTRRMNRQLGLGTAAGTEVVMVRRGLGEWRQGTGRHKSDLSEQLGAMGRLGPSVASALDGLLAAGDGVERSEDLVVLDGALPACLGGPMGPCEQRRVLRVTARYAAWRDRRLRRLAVVEALADEVWPVPDDGERLAWAAAATR